MNGTPLTKEQNAEFDRAVARFAGNGLVCVTLQKMDAFLDQTRGIAAPRAQRLRWLAIALENRSFERGWEGLRMIYRAAAEADPTDFRILHSWGISASDCARCRVDTPNLEERKAIADEAEQILQAALDLAPRDSRVAHTLGMLSYNHPARAEDAENGSANQWLPLTRRSAGALSGRRLETDRGTGQPTWSADAAAQCARSPEPAGGSRWP